MNENAEISACKKHQNPKAKKRQRPMIIIIIPIPDQDLLWPVYGFYLGYFLSSIPPNGPGPYGMTELSATRMGYRDTCYLGPRIQEMQCICYDIDPRYSRNPKKTQEIPRKLCCCLFSPFIQVCRWRCRAFEAVLHMSPPSVDAYSAAAKAGPGFWKFSGASRNWPPVQTIFFECV